MGLFTPGAASWGTSALFPVELREILTCGSARREGVSPRQRPSREPAPSPPGFLRPAHGSQCPLFPRSPGVATPSPRCPLTREPPEPTPGQPRGQASLVADFCVVFLQAPPGAETARASSPTGCGWGRGGGGEGLAPAGRREHRVPSARLTGRQP